MQCQRRHTDDAVARTTAHGSEANIRARISSGSVSMTMCHQKSAAQSSATVTEGGGGRKRKESARTGINTPRAPAWPPGIFFPCGRVCFFFRGCLLLLYGDATRHAPFFFGIVHRHERRQRSADYSCCSWCLHRNARLFFCGPLTGIFRVAGSAFRRRFLDHTTNRHDGR